MGLVPAKTARVDEGCGGNAGRVFGRSGLIAQLESCADQFPGGLAEPEFVGSVPQPFLAAESVNEKLLPFLQVRVLRNAPTLAREVEARSDEQWIARHQSPVTVAVQPSSRVIFMPSRII